HKGNTRIATTVGGHIEQALIIEASPEAALRAGCPRGTQIEKGEPLMSMEMHVVSASPKTLLQTVLSALRQGSVGMAVEQFDHQFIFIDHGLGLEFEDKGRLTEFFTKTRELYPDSGLLVDFLLETDDYVIAEWTLRNTVVEPFYGGLTRTVPIIL